MSDVETIKVLISATERIRLEKIIKIPVRDWLEYEAMCERDAPEEEFSEWAERYFDVLNDVVDGGEYEDVECTQFASDTPAQEPKE